MRRQLPLLAAAVLTLTGLSTVPASAATDTASFARWTSTSDFAKGTSQGLAPGTGKMTLAKGTVAYKYDDPNVAGGSKSYDRGSWQSPWSKAGFSATSLIPSWSVTTPGGTWARIDVRVRKGSKTGSWDTVARWATGESSIKRSSYSSQGDDLAKLATDTVLANAGQSFDQWQVRVVLLKPKGTTKSPTLHAVNGIAATYATRAPKTTSTTTMKATTDLAVPMSSQMIHKNQNKQWDGGGAAWCSPTSTSMVMRYFKKGPVKADYTWAKNADAWVNHAARYTYDYRFKGTGNWPFNTAYAAGYSLDTFVTRMHSLRDAEAFIKAGIPVVASVAFSRGGLTGAPLSSTPGHLMVIRGFTKGGSVIVNDPAAPSNSSVRRTYNRAQFEKAWLKGSGGVSYVIRPTSRALPKDTSRW